MSHVSDNLEVRLGNRKKIDITPSIGGPEEGRYDIGPLVVVHTRWKFFVYFGV